MDREIDASVRIYVWSIVLSMVMFYLLTIICGLYPSWLATKAKPATALCHE
jgi:ABC-type antimicrobial peptide transport system permease subunit